MKKTRPKSGGGRAQWRRVIAAATAAIAFGGALLLPQAAAAADYTYSGVVDAESIVLTPVEDPTDLYLWSNVRIDATWAVPDGAVAGETFGLTLPAEFEGRTAPFAAMSTGPNPQAVANCVISGAGSREVTCTLTDYVNGKSGVNGALWFVAQAIAQTNETTVDFAVDGAVVPVDLPGEGGIIRIWMPASEPIKTGSQDNSGLLQWEIVLPGSDFADTDTVTITDRFAPESATNAAHTFDTLLTVYTETNADGTRAEVDPAAFSFVADADGLGYTLVLDGPLDPALQYGVAYRTTPTAPSPGAIYENTADIGGVAVSSSVQWEATGGGDGDGDLPGTFRLAKLIDGSGSDLVDPSRTFTVRYSYGDPIVEKTLVVAADGTVVSSDPIPADTVVTLEEITPLTMPGYTWAAATFSGEGATDLGGGRATITIDAGADVALTLTNTALETTGGFSILKEVGGTGKDLAPAGAAYDFEYAVNDGAAQELQVRAGNDPIVVNGIRVGSTVVLTELIADDVAGGLWAGVEFLVDGAPQGASATVTIAADTIVEVRVVNTLSRIIPPVVPGGETTAVADPTAETLARTGGELSVVSAAGGIAVLLVGLVLAIALRRRNESGVGPRTS